MKSVERVESLPKLGCCVKPFRFDIFVGNRLAVPFPDAKYLQPCKPLSGLKGALRPMDRNGQRSGS